MNSIIDLDVREEYEKDTGKLWSEYEERMAEICSFYGYGFAWNKKGNIVINNGYYEDKNNEFYKFYGYDIENDCNDRVLRHYEYISACDMVNKWLNICITTNNDYLENNQEKPFDWC